MGTQIRLAAPADARQIADIYAPFCGDASAVSFEVTPPTIAEMALRITAVLERYPWLVCDRDGAILGYAYAGPYRERAAFAWTVETAVYVRAETYRSGIGRGLYVALFGILAGQGFRTAVAAVTVPNPASVALHRALGFASTGVQRRIGYKAGAWRDVEWWQRPLGEPEDKPKPLTRVNEVKVRPWFETALADGIRCIRL